jgi:hypothetical protein
MVMALGGLDKLKAQPLNRDSLAACLPQAAVTSGIASAWRFDSLQISC